MKLEWESTHKVDDHKLTNWSTHQYFESENAQEKDEMSEWSWRWWSQSTKQWSRCQQEERMKVTQSHHDKVQDSIFAQ